MKMILMISMKVSVIGSSNDVKFFLNRAFHLNKKDIIFSVFDSRENQENIRKQFKFIETPWGIEDILFASDLIINAMPLRRSNEFYEIIKNNNVNLPIIDLSPIKEFSIKDYDENNIKNSVIHIMPPGKMNLSYKKESLRVPVVLNNKSSSIENNQIENFFKLLKLNYKFIDHEEHDSLVMSHYISPNLYLLHLMENMETKANILSNDFNREVINDFSSFIDNEILENLNDEILKMIKNNEINLDSFISSLKVNNYKLKNKNISFKETNEILSIPKSKDTLLSLFFGEKFSRVISSWGKERK